MVGGKKEREGKEATRQAICAEESQKRGRGKYDQQSTKKKNDRESFNILDSRKRKRDLRNITKNAISHESEKLARIVDLWPLQPYSISREFT